MSESLNAGVTATLLRQRMPAELLLPYPHAYIHTDIHTSYIAILPFPHTFIHSNSAIFTYIHHT